MSHDDRLTRHLRALAETAVPDGLRPDPPLSARVDAAARRRAGSRRLGWATLAAALLVATLGLILLSRVPDAPLTSAAQGPTLVPSAMPTETPRPELISLVLDTTPQTITLHGAQTLLLLALPEAGELIVEVVTPPAVSGPVVVGYRPEARPLFSFDPALTQRLRLALAASPGDVTLFLDSGAASGDAEVTLRAWVEAPAGSPQPIPALDVPDGRVAMTLPNDLTGVLGPALAAGQAVDVYATILFAETGEFQVPLGMNTPEPDATPGLSTQRLIDAAPVLLVTNAGISLAVSPQDSVTLTWLIQAGMPFTLVRAQATAANRAEPDGVTAEDVLPPGKVAVALPLQPVSIIGGEVAVGQPVDVYLTFMYVDVNEEFQAPLVTPPPAVGTTIASPLLGLATGTPDPAATPQLTTQRTVQGAAVLALDAATITLAVSPQEATVLTWAIDAQLPITLIPVGE